MKDLSATVRTLPLILRLKEILLLFTFLNSQFVHEGQCKQLTANWGALGILTGAVRFSSCYTTKVLLDRWLLGLPTDVYAILVGWASLTLTQIALGLHRSNSGFYNVLSGANGLLVALAAGQMHNKILNPPGTTATETKTGALIVTETKTKGDVT